jgi:hypothetical protein
MSQGSTWSSAWASDHSQINISIYQNGKPETLITQFTVAPDGSGLTESSSAGYTVLGASKVSTGATCDGQTAIR